MYHGLLNREGQNICQFSNDFHTNITSKYAHFICSCVTVLLLIKLILGFLIVHGMVWMIYCVHQTRKHFSPEGVLFGVETLADRVLVVKAIVLLCFQCKLGPPFFSFAIWVTRKTVRSV